VAGSTRAESARRIVELTGLGIAATYFLDPIHGAERRRTAWGWVAGSRADRRVAGAPAPAALVEPAPVAEDAPLPAPEPEPEPEELVLLGGELLGGTAASVAPGRDLYWPSWGWPLVLTITVCSLAAFAAVGVGVWAITHRATDTRTVVTPDLRAAAVLADPAARRIVGTAVSGNVLLRLDAAGAALSVAGLPPLPRGRRYRVWVTTGGTATAARSFAGRRAVVALPPLPARSRVTITREPAGARPDAPRGPGIATVTVEP
jgi:hypothetical protein